VHLLALKKSVRGAPRLQGDGTRIFATICRHILRGSIRKDA